MSTSLRSSSVTLDNVDDYLAPSQACVNPAFQPESKIGEGGDPKDDATTSTVGVVKDESESSHVVVPRRRRRIVRKKIISTDAELPETGTSTFSPPISKKEEEEKKKKTAVKASMADCLACSGCVTTAETVMMEERHSLKSLRERLTSSKGADRPRVITISPNSWADICRHWNLDSSKAQQQPLSYQGDEDKKEENACHYEDDNDSNNDHNFYYSRFTTLLSKILSVKIVVDGNIPLQWTWIDEAQEFCQIYRENQEQIISLGDADRNKNSTPLPSMAIDSSKTLYYKSDGTSEINDNCNRPSPNLPLISGSCPALVCLVEKTLTKLVPHLSQSVSPMSLVGMLLKKEDDNDNDNDNGDNNVDNMGVDDDTAKSNDVSSSNWDHWAIMPCHDKKLEASRKDFAQKKNAEEQAVDLVISTQECVELVEEWIRSQKQKDDQMQPELSTNISVARYLASLPPSDVSTIILEPEDLLQRSSYATDKSQSPLLVTTPVISRGEDAANSVTTAAVQKQMAFSSGGHANFIFLYAAKHLFGCTLEDQGVQVEVEWKAASLAMKNVRSARLGKLLKQHYYEAKLYRYPDGSYGTASAVSSESDESSSSPIVALHFAIAHGMQTMQRALKQVVERPTIAGNNGSKSATGSLHYLEAMACPHGCVNGGGSVRSSLSSSLLTSTKASTSSSASLIRETPTETRMRVQSTLGYLEVPPINNNAVTSARSNFPRTEYHVVPPMSYNTGAVAGVKVENMVW